MSERLIRFYYWLTPAFWAVDFLLGANLRAAALEGHPAWKLAYYLFCLACGVVVWLRPGWTRMVGLTESSVNVLSLVLGMVLPYLRLIEQLAARESAIDASPFGVEKALGLLLSGAVWAVSFQIHAAGLERRSRAASASRIASSR